MLYLRFCAQIYLSLATIVGQWLNRLIFHDNIRCIIANGQIMIKVGAD